MTATTTATATTQFIQVMGLLIITGLGITIWLFRKGGFYRNMPSTDNEKIVIPAPSTPSVAPILPPEASNPQVAPLSPLDFSTPQKAFKSTRIICDEMGLTFDQKETICGMIYQESEFKKGAIGKPNKNGSIDYGLCQFNNGTLHGVPLWIGKGATFASTDEVLNNPEKCVRVMVKTCLAGHWNWWMSYSQNSYQQWLKPNSPMRALA